MMQTTSARGLTLIELIITVAIIGILGVIGATVYTKQTQKGRRADAIMGMTQLQNELEKCYSRNGSYVVAANCSVDDQNTVNPLSGESHYLIDVERINGDAGYTLVATPLSSSPQADDDCQQFTLNNLGQKGGTEPKCWP